MGSFIHWHGRPKGWARVGRRPPPGKKKFEKKCTKKNLTCKRPPLYVMRGTFITKGPHVRRLIFTRKAPMLGVKFLLKKGPHVMR